MSKNSTLLDDIVNSLEVVSSNVRAEEDEYISIGNLVQDQTLPTDFARLPITNIDIEHELEFGQSSPSTSSPSTDTYSDEQEAVIAVSVLSDAQLESQYGNNPRVRNLVKAVVDYASLPKEDLTKPHQDKAIKQYAKGLINGKINAVFAMATGSGKTYIIAKLAQAIAKREHLEDSQSEALSDNAHSRTNALVDGSRDGIELGQASTNSNNSNAQTNGKVLILVPFIQLRKQTIGALNRYTDGLRPLVVEKEANFDYAEHDIVIMTYDMAHRRKITFTDFATVIADEAHNALSATNAALILRAKVDGCAILAFTATPEYNTHSNHREYNSIYKLLGYDNEEDNPVDRYTIAQAIQEGVIAPVKIAMVTPNLSEYKDTRKLLGKLNSSGSDDFSEQRTAMAINKPPFNKLAVDIYANGCDPDNSNRFRDQQAIVFCANIEHAQNVAEEFNSLDIDLIDPEHKHRDNYANQLLKIYRDKNTGSSDNSAEEKIKKRAYHDFKIAAAIHSVTGLQSNKKVTRLPEQERKKLLEQYEQGGILVLTGADQLIEGFDVPRTSVVINLRLTKSDTLAVQRGGRGGRIDASNPNKIWYVIDFNWNIKRQCLFYNYLNDDSVTTYRMGDFTTKDAYYRDLGKITEFTKIDIPGKAKTNSEQPLVWQAEEEIVKLINSFGRGRMAFSGRNIMNIISQNPQLKDILLVFSQILTKVTELDNHSDKVKVALTRVKASKSSKIRRSSMSKSIDTQGADITPHESDQQQETSSDSSISGTSNTVPLTSTQLLTQDFTHDLNHSLKEVDTFVDNLHQAINISADYNLDSLIDAGKAKRTSTRKRTKAASDNKEAATPSLERLKNTRYKVNRLVESIKEFFFKNMHIATESGLLFGDSPSVSASVLKKMAGQLKASKLVLDELNAVSALSDLSSTPHTDSSSSLPFSSGSSSTSDAMSISVQETMASELEKDEQSREKAIDIYLKIAEIYRKKIEQNNNSGTSVIFEVINVQKQLANIYYKIAHLYALVGECDLAISYVKQSLATSRNEDAQKTIFKIASRSSK